MKRFSRDQMIRVVVTLTILLSGLALAPFIDIPAQAAINWQSLAGVYEPNLEVNEPSGLPGSIFAFTGSNYPPNAVATLYVNGTPLGTMITDGGGIVTFMLDTTDADSGQYSVTVEANANASATTSVELEEDGTIVTPPEGFTGPTFHLIHTVYLPVVTKG